MHEPLFGQVGIRDVSLFGRGDFGLDHESRHALLCAFLQAGVDQGFLGASIAKAWNRRSHAGMALIQWGFDLEASDDVADSI